MDVGFERVFSFLWEVITALEWYNEMVKQLKEQQCT